MNPVRRLLVLSCSQKKRPDPGLLPAIERYDGPMFRVIRKFLRECPSETQNLDIFILSAEFGLIPATKRIGDYYHRMTPHRAVELQPQVLAELKRVLEDHQYKELFISVGQDYLGALAGYGVLVSGDLKVTVSNGGRGRKQAELYTWLRGGLPNLLHRTVATSQRGSIRIRGIEITLTPDEVLGAARRALAEDRGDPTRYWAWYVQVDDQQVAIKWLVSQLTGLPVSDFTTGEARRVLGQLGIKVVHI